MATEPEVNQSPEDKDAKGPLAVLESEGRYSFESLTYPISGIGDEIPSYIVFYINLPQHPQYEKIDRSGQLSTSDQNVDLSRKGIYTAIPEGKAGTAVATAVGIDVATDTFNVAQGGISNLGERVSNKFGKQVLKTPLRAALGSVASNIKIKQKYNRLKKAIAIYMPDTIFHTNNHDYDAKSITEVLGTLGMAQRAGSQLASALEEIGPFSVEEGIKKAASSQGGAEVVGRILEKTTDLVGQGFSDLIVRSTGVAINPRIELLYRATQNRSFIYEFKFQPSSEKETKNIQNIIKTFKAYAAPDIQGSGGNQDASYFIPPGQFDIEYRFRSGVNDNIGRISTCVLENIAVNYSSAGQFATFSDGMPVEISLQLTFREVDIITRGMIEERGF